MALHARARWRSLRRRVRSAVLPPSGPPILVFQMGKVGSSSVYRSLVECDLRREIDQVHLLAGLDEIEAWARAKYPDPRSVVAQIEHARRIRDRVIASPDTQWIVITLVRDPVQRNVSAFFENLTGVIPDASERIADGSLEVDELRRAFLERSNHGAPLSWFRSQMEPVFGIDVYATSFPRARGYATYESARAELLLLRLEDLRTVGAGVIGDFLGIDGFTLQSRNVGSTKAYADLYAAFAAEAELPSAYLDRMYDSEYARHFYSATEIEQFRLRWGGSTI